MPTVQLLGPGDEPALDKFLARHADTSMFLRSNARAAGLVDHGAPMQGTYVAALERGAVAAVAAHCWNGVVLVQAPAHLEAVVREAVRRSGRAVTGLSGPWTQVAAARAALGLDRHPTPKDSREDLYGLDLADLVVPAALAAGAVRCRAPHAGELELLTEWRAAFAVEALGAADGPELRADGRRDVELHHARASHWVLLEGTTPAAYCAFNARLPEIVQIGGVWTPPERRGRGHARAVVAGALLTARQQGARRAVLFADPANPSARAAYEALGFRRIGDYGLVLFRG